MRRFLLLSASISLVVALSIAGAGAAMATVVAPFHPGDALFPLQLFAEQTAMALSGTGAGQAEYAASVASQRVVDLELAAGSKNEAAALTYLNEALDQAARALASASPAEAAGVRPTLIGVLQRAQTALGLLTIVPQEAPDALAAMQAKVNTLLSVAQDPNATPSDFQQVARADPASAPASAPLPTATVEPIRNAAKVDPQRVVFPPKSPGAVHAFYPLLGGHAATACQACHTTGRYAGTPKDCSACHTKDVPVRHYNGGCDACHGLASWSEIGRAHV
jgi:hypothetical protein